MSAVQAPKAASSEKAEEEPERIEKSCSPHEENGQKMASGVLARAADVAAPRARTPPDDAEPSIPS